MNMLKFASLIGYIAAVADRVFTFDEIHEVHQLVEMCNEQPQPIKADPGELQELMMALGRPNKKIEAIKAHQALTGYGLRESKEAVEAAWRGKPAIPMFNAMMDALDQDNDMLPSQRDSLRSFVNKFRDFC